MNFKAMTSTGKRSNVGSGEWPRPPQCRVAQRVLRPISYEHLSAPSSRRDRATETVFFPCSKLEGKSSRGAEVLELPAS